MKKCIMLMIALTGNVAFAKQIPQETAKIVAKNFLQRKTDYGTGLSLSDLKLIHKEESLFPRTETYYYVYGTTIGKGFVIVSGDDVVIPVLGYSKNTTFSTIHMPSNVQSWIENYRNQIREAIQKEIEATPEITTEWQSLLSSDIPHGVHKTTSVTPLLQTTWSQNPYYNAMCPAGTVTGCVATAMAQVMKYWSYPSTGTGFHSYNSIWGIQSANFGITTYNWGNMPNNVSGTNLDVAKLMYHCGVSVNMSFGNPSTGGSGAFVISSTTPTTNAPYCAEYALKNYFGYNATTIQGVQRSSYTDPQWIALIEAELNAIPARPVIYAGFGNNNGHCFVCDGYDNNNFLHFNFGWGGTNNGYYSINAVNPSSTMTFNSGQEAIIGLKPANQPNYNIKLHDYITPISTSIPYGTTISANTNFWNTSTLNFSGDFTAALFDQNLNFVDYIQTIPNSLPANNIFISNQTFSIPNIWTAIPGHYYIGMFSRPTSGNYVQVGNNNSYMNPVAVDIVNPSGVLNLYDSIVVSGGNVLTSGQPVSVHLDVATTSASSFHGRLKLDLWNYSSGSLSFVANIGTMVGVNLLPNQHFINGLTFSTSSLSAPAGTHLLGLSHIDTTTSTQIPYWTGSSLSSNFINPIIVSVVPSPLQPDQYEVNNTPTTAYTFSPVFSGNAAQVHTSNANIHINTDEDYYKINLPAGYNYTITPSLSDAIYPVISNAYTLDAIFSSSVNGSAWSSAYDDAEPSFQINNGGPLYFWVASHYNGLIGTYVLNVNITRTQIPLSLSPTVTDNIGLYPNPSTGAITLSLPYSASLYEISIANIVGKEVLKTTASGTSVTIDLSSHPNGIYFAHISNGTNQTVKKIEVNH